jgi:tetratricopeptide (TPR) repeat protein
VAGEPVHPESIGTSNELPGTVFGPAVQAGSIRDVHFHRTEHESPVPRQLPPAAPHFISRAGELAQLDALLDNGRPRLAVLTGPGGVGKTALALRWAHAARSRFPEGQLHIDLGGFGADGPLDAGAALGALLRGLGVPPKDIPATVAEQTALFRSVTAERCIILILDNAFSAAQARMLIPASAASATIVTSRSRLAGLVPDGALLIDVPPLPSEDSIALLTRTLGAARIAREPDQAEALAGICGGLPLALCVAAARLAARPRLSLARVAEELADETTRLAGLSMQQDLSVRAVFDVSYRQLDAGAATLYRRLALHPGAEFGSRVVDALTAAIGPPGAGPPVEQLLQASLLQETDEDRFRYHDLVRLHARLKADTDETPGDREAAVVLMAEWYLQAARRADDIVTPGRRRPAYPLLSEPAGLPRFGGFRDALAWLERERANLVAAGRVALELGHPALAWQLCDVLWPLLLFFKPPLRERLDVDSRGVQAARASGDAWAEAVMLKRLGRVSAKLGDHAAAEAHTRAAIRRYEDAGDAPGRLDAQEGLAVVYLESGREQQAAQLLAEMLEGNRRLGRRRNVGLALISLGLVRQRLGRAADAVAPLREARAVFNDLAGADPHSANSYNEARATAGLAGALLAVGDLPAAQTAATEAVQRMRALGTAHELAEATTLLARIARRRGDAETARQHFRTAVGMFTAAGSPRAAAVREELHEAP